MVCHPRWLAPLKKRKFDTDKGNIMWRQRNKIASNRPRREDSEQNINLISDFYSLVLDKFKSLLFMPLSLEFLWQSYQTSTTDNFLNYYWMRHSYRPFLLFYFYWSVVDLHCCVNFRYAAKGISYAYTSIHSFSYSFPIQPITEYWVDLPVVYMHFYICTYSVAQSCPTLWLHTR